MIDESRQAIASTAGVRQAGVRQAGVRQAGMPPAGGRFERAAGLAGVAVDSGQDVLAEFLSLRWAHFGRLEYAIPVAMLLVAIHFSAQMPAPLAGVPFWAVSSAAIVAAVACREIAARTWPDRSLPGRLLLALAVEVVVFWVLYDLLYLGLQRHLYDIDVYLGSAGRWVDGGQPYLTHTLSEWPAVPAQDYFLYPPPLLPFFGLLSRLPHTIVVYLWLVGLVAAALAAYRLLGMRWRWAIAMLAFPPMFIGIESGNVATIAFLLFAAAIRAGGLLPALTLFKVQSGIPALWLVRERRWTALLAGGAAIAAICLATLPLTGIGAWGDWLAGLEYRAASQAGVPAFYGMSFAHYLPAAVYIAIAVALVAVALLIPGRRGLAALGVSSIWASPALWPHGFLFALPALLFAENSVLVWLLLGAGAVDINTWYLFYGAGLIVLAAPRARSGRLHLVDGSADPDRADADPRADSDPRADPDSAERLA